MGIPIKCGYTSVFSLGLLGHELGLTISPLARPLLTGLQLNSPIWVSNLLIGLGFLTLSSIEWSVSTR